MSEELTAVATFSNPVEANLAKNQLEEAGIPCFLTGEEVVSMTWAFSNAVGGIKLQVPLPFASQAQALLAETSSVSNTALTEAALGAEGQEGNAAGFFSEAMVPEEDAEPELTSREQNAERAWRGAWLFMLFLPLQIYVFYLLLKVFVSDEPLGNPHRRHAWQAAAINGPLLIGICIFLRMLLIH